MSRPPLTTPARPRHAARPATTTRSAPCGRRRAFTLVELLVVVAIIGVLVALTAAGTLGLITSARLAEATSLVHQEFTNAARHAQLHDREVEVRLFAIPDAVGEGSSFRLFQLFVIDPPSDPGDAGYHAPGAAAMQTAGTAIGSPVRLPEGIVFHSSEDFSTLLTDPARQAPPGLNLPDNSATDVRRFRLLPRGGTDLARGRHWTLTLCEQRLAGRPGLPDDYSTMRIEPSTGRIAWFRPN